MSDRTEDDEMTMGTGGFQRPVPSNARRAAAVAVAAALVSLAVIGGGLAWAFWSFSRQVSAPGTSASPEPISKAGVIEPSHSAETTAVPDVVTLQLAAASQRLQASGLKTGTVTRVFVDGATTGSVIRQAPVSRQVVPVGSAVALTVSAGTLSAELPPVVGLTVAAAKSALERAGLTVGSVKYVYSERVKSGVVMSMETDGSTRPERGDSVNLTASKGRTPVTMPAIVGLTPAKALEICQSVELGLSFKPAGASEGIVTAQSPAAGSPIAPGSSANCSVDTPPQASISAKITKIDDTWVKYNKALGAHITCTSTSVDGQGIASLSWQVEGLDVKASGTGNQISFILPGYRRYGTTSVYLTVVDTAGQTSKVRKIIKVNWDTGTLQ